MKVICAVITESGAVSNYYLMADSSLLQQRKPFFVPEYDGGITYRPALVVRIGRLGKNIARKFANRYYDAVSVGLAMQANGLRGNTLTDMASHCFDGSAPIGEFVAFGGDIQRGAVPMRLTLDGEVIEDQVMNIDFDGIIEHLSRFLAMKMGDMIFAVKESDGKTIEPEHRFEGFIGEQKVFEMKTK